MRHTEEPGGHWFGNQYVRPRSKKMSHTPEQMRQKAEALRMAEKHQKMNVVGEESRYREANRAFDKAENMSERNPENQRNYDKSVKDISQENKDKYMDNMIKENM